MSVFKASYANQYDALYGDKDYAAECDLVQQAATQGGVSLGRILDIGCGTGGHSYEWARRGVTCVGVDMSPDMIALAEGKMGGFAGSVPPTFMVGDAQSFEASAKFDVATLMFAVLGYMTSNEAVLAALRNARAHLEPGGLLAFDCWYGPAVLSVRPDERVRVVDHASGQTIRSASTAIDSYNHLANVTFKLWSVVGDRYLGYSEETHTMRYFFPQELKLLLESAGFNMVSLASFPGNAQPTDDTWNVFCVAKAV